VCVDRKRLWLDLAGLTAKKVLIAQLKLQKGQMRLQ